MKYDFMKKVEGVAKDIPLAVIDMQAYGTMNGEKVLKQAESIMNK